jgi:hypothetical protein
MELHFHGSYISSWDGAYTSRQSTYCILTRIGAEEPGFDSWYGQVVFLFIESRSAVGPTKTPIEWVPGGGGSICGRGVVTTHLHLVARSRMVEL